MVNICPKLDQRELKDKELVRKLLDQGFSGFELYTRTKNNWKELSDIILDSELETESVHAPVKLENDGWFNLCMNDDTANRSTDVLNEVIQLSKRINCKKVVFHAWAISYIDGNDNLIEDIEKESREGRVKLVKNMAQVACPKVVLFPEISPLVFWLEDLLTMYSVLYSPKDFEEIIDLASEIMPSQNIGLTLDIDHLYRTAISHTIQECLIQELKSGRSRKEILNNVCKQMLVHYNNDPKCTNYLVRKEFTNLFNKLTELDNPELHIHACGIAHPEENLIKSNLLVLLGEHIPIGYKGISSAGTVMGYVEDVMDPKIYLEHLKGTDTPIIIEFDPRKDYDFFEQVINSRDYLEKCLSEL